VTKRAIDLVLASVALVLLSPVLAVLWVLVRLRMGSPVLFRQQRPGRHGRPFEMVKFRTMTDARDADGNLRPDAERLTALGKLLRRTSLDELPELLNVLNGDMSLVGPRPLLMQYLPLYSPEQARRHEVRPGITGWAQVNGARGATPTIQVMQDRVNLDAWYVEHAGLALDLTILARTPLEVLRTRNAL